MLPRSSHRLIKKSTSRKVWFRKSNRPFFPSATRNRKHLSSLAWKLASRSSIIEIKKLFKFKLKRPWEAKSHWKCDFFGWTLPLSSALLSFWGPSSELLSSWESGDELCVFEWEFENLIMMGCSIGGGLIKMSLLSRSRSILIKKMCQWSVKKWFNTFNGVNKVNAKVKNILNYNLNKSKTSTISLEFHQSDDDLDDKASSSPSQRSSIAR